MEHLDGRPGVRLVVLDLVNRAESARGDHAPHDMGADTSADGKLGGFHGRRVLAIAGTES
jgi:hypothetical protein